MQLRKFAAYDKTAAQSLFTIPCTLIKLDGNYTGSGSEFLQIFDKASVAVANDIPIASFTLTGAGPLPSIFETMGAVPLLLGLSIGISSVNEKYTASASGFDVFGGISEPELPATGTTTVGDLTTGVLYKQVWSEATGPKSLLEMDIINGEGAVAYALLFAKDTINDGDVPIEAFTLLNNSSVQTFNFGRNGRAVQQFTTPSTLRIGCGIIISSTANVLTSGGVSNKIRAIYK